jgi:hypothetical protein
MRPRERRDSGGQDLFRARLEQIIDLNHELAKLARAIDWRFLEEKFGAVYTDRPRRPPLPTRLMAGLARYIQQSPSRHDLWASRGKITNWPARSGGVLMGRL